MRQGASLYDSYQLANSNAIPHFVGDTGEAANTVGQYLQGIYDTASTYGNALGDTAQNTPGLVGDDPVSLKIRPQAQELYQNTVNKLQEWSKAGDWEHHLPDVTSLGRQYMMRSQELQQPFLQKQAYIKTLDEQDKDKPTALTPEQKATLIQRADAGFQGMKKDNMGRLSGSYIGPQAAKNVNYPEWVDKFGKDFAANEGGTELKRGTDGQWMVLQGDHWKMVEPDRVQNAYNAAIASDTSMQAYLDMEGDNAAFHASRITDPNHIQDKTLDGKPNIVKMQALQIANSQGIPFGDALGRVAKYNRQAQLQNAGLQYAIDKYSHIDDNTKDLAEANPFWQKEPSLVGDVVVGNGKEVLKKYGDASGLEAAGSAASDALGKATSFVNQEKNNAARDLKKSVDQITDDDMANYYAKNNNPGARSRYQAQQATVDAQTQTIKDINTIKDQARDEAAKKMYPGTAGFSALRDEATKNLQTAVSKGLLNPGALTTLNPYVSGFGRGTNASGGSSPITKDNVGNFTVEDADNPAIGKKTITVRDKTTGKEYQLYHTESAGEGTFAGIAPKMNKLDWKKGYQDALQGVRTNTTSFTLPDHSGQMYDAKGALTKVGAQQTRLKAILRAGALDIKDQDDNPLSDKDRDKMQALISAGKFNPLSIGSGDGGKFEGKISVEVDPTASDPRDRYKTLNVGAESGITNQIADWGIEGGKQYQDKDMYDLGFAMKPGSSYKALGDAVPLYIKDKNGTITHKVIPGATGSGTSYQIYNTDASGKPTTLDSKTGGSFSSRLSLGTYLDHLKMDGKSITKKP